MIHQVVAVYDSKARAYALPFFVAHTDVALRSMAQVANDPSHQVFHAPQDFTLFHIGTYDDTLGVVAMFPSQVNLGLASQFKQAQQPGQVRNIVINEDKLFPGRS